MQEALERAYACDKVGQPEKALRMYEIALSAIEEALGLPVLGNGKPSQCLCWDRDACPSCHAAG